MLFIGYFLGRYIPGIDQHIEPVILVVIFVSLLPGLISWRRERSAAAAAAHRVPRRLNQPENCTWRSRSRRCRIAYDALEPHIDAQTMEIHHTKHHQAYVNNLNAALEKAPELRGQVARRPDARTSTPCPRPCAPPCATTAAATGTTRMFWELMGPNAGGEPTGKLADAIKSAFGDFAKFKEQFAAAGAGRFGSGWAWLVNDGGKLVDHEHAEPGQPAHGRQAAPILGLDVWEHAYYLKYQNRRPDYITAWWNVVNWDEVAKRFG